MPWDKWQIVQVQHFIKKLEISYKDKFQQLKIKKGLRQEDKLVD